MNECNSNPEADLRAIDECRRRGERVVFTNGCFDLIHVGHVRYLSEARSKGDILVVGLNTDSSVRRLKGDRRPLVPQNERREILRALRMVDFVCLFDEDTPLELIRRVCPDVLVKGGDWKEEAIVGSEFVRGRGGVVMSLPYVEGHSTSELIERLRNV